MPVVLVVVMAVVAYVCWWIGREHGIGLGIRYSAEREQEAFRRRFGTAERIAAYEEELANEDGSDWIDP